MMVPLDVRICPDVGLVRQQPGDRRGHLAMFINKYNIGVEMLRDGKPLQEHSHLPDDCFLPLCVSSWAIVDFCSTMPSVDIVAGRPDCLFVVISTDASSASVAQHDCPTVTVDMTSN